MSHDDKLRKLLDSTNGISSAKSLHETLKGTARLELEKLQDRTGFLRDISSPEFQLSAINSAAMLNSIPTINSLIGHSAASIAANIEFEKLALQGSKNISEIFNSNITLPTAPSLQAMFDTFNAQAMKAHAEIVINEWRSPLANIEESIRSMQQPWLDLKNPVASFTGLAELQNIGQALRNQYPFGDALTNQLREDFGDWRKVVEYDAFEISNPITRARIYFDKGLDRSLTAFPDNSFYEATLRAGLREYIEIVPEDQIHEIEIESTEEDIPSEERLETAFIYVSRFERHMRKFIVQHMFEAFGEKWILQNVPGAISKKWKEAEALARDRGQRVVPLIEYADFTHYKEIIVSGNNWQQVFKRFFHSKESITESFQRMYLFRNSAMHSRSFTKEDEIFLLTETSRILKAIGVKTSLEGEIRLIIKQ